MRTFDRINSKPVDSNMEKQGNLLVVGKKAKIEIFLVLQTFQFLRKKSSIRVGVGVDRTQSYSSIVAHTIATFYSHEWFTIQFNQFVPLESSTSPFRSVYLHRILTLFYLYSSALPLHLSNNHRKAQHDTIKPKIKIS